MGNILPFRSYVRSQQTPQSAVVEELPIGTLVRLGDKPMEVAAADIVAVRAAMGYPV